MMIGFTTMTRIDAFCIVLSMILIVTSGSRCWYVECFSPSPALDNRRFMTKSNYAITRPSSYGGTTQSSSISILLLLLHSENPNKGSSAGSSSSEEEIVGEKYEGNVDWDAEWQKVVQNRDQPTTRPGNYKSPVEIAAIKATNKVAKNVFDASQDMKSNMPSALPSFQSLQGDWRFWIGIIVIVSFGLSILSATSVAPVNDSFYI